MMTSRTSTALSVLSICATLHLSVMDLALAETPLALKDAASQANTNTFKPKPSDLYSRTGQTITIKNGSPTGDVTFKSDEMNYGVIGQSAGPDLCPRSPPTRTCTPIATPSWASSKPGLANTTRPAR